MALSGKAWTNNLYVKLISEGDMQEDFPASSKESMIPALSVAEDIAPPTQPLLVMFTHKRSADSAKVTKRELEIGCIKSNLVKKTSGEYSFDMTSATNPSAKSFSFDTLKVKVAVLVSTGGDGILNYTGNCGSRGQQGHYHHLCASQGHPLLFDCIQWFCKQKVFTTSYPLHSHSYFQLTLKGSIIQVHQLLLRALICE